MRAADADAKHDSSLAKWQTLVVAMPMVRCLQGSYCVIKLHNRSESTPFSNGVKTRRMQAGT
jgi:hypothetical protein